MAFFPLKQAEFASERRERAFFAGVEQLGEANRAATSLEAVADVRAEMTAQINLLREEQRSWASDLLEQLSEALGVVGERLSSEVGSAGGRPGAASAVVGRDQRVTGVPLPTGAIVAMDTTAPPPHTAWVQCDGVELQIDVYRNLYSVIGDKFRPAGGSVGDGMFKVPESGVHLPALGLDYAWFIRT